jgi:hypothetical protein
MGIDRKGQRCCDRCGRLMDKAVRIHLGAEYCRACYQTQFVKVACSRCAQSMRGHRLSLEPVCSTCERSERTCLRCRRLTPRASKLVEGKPVCPSCAVYFRPELLCDGCGEKSRRVFSSLIDTAAKLECDDSNGENRKRVMLCQSCSIRSTHATCSVCRRHRRHVADTLGGKPLCAACAAAPTTHNCPACGELIAGTGQGRCLPCTLRASASRKALVLRAGLEHSWCQDLWDEFARRLIGSRQHLHKASKILAASLPYFQVVDGIFEERSEITADALHELIASPVHRRHLLAYRFFLVALGVRNANEVRDQFNEARRLEAILVRAQGRAYAPLLENFVDALRAKGVASRTIRLYTGVAQNFCERSCATAESAWAPQAILEFLQHTPGAASSLSAFVGFCRRYKGWSVRIPDKQTLQMQVGFGQHAVARLKKALSSVEGRSVESLKLMEVVRVMSAATGLASRALLSASIDASEHSGGTIVLSEEAQIAPGHPLYPYARQWLRLIGSRFEVSS